MANLGNKRRMVKSVSQVAMDHTHALFLYLPFFYTLQACVYGNEVSWEKVGRGLKTCSENWNADAWNMSLLYLPTQYVNFAYVPCHWRVCFVAGISMCWCTILSLLRGSRTELP